MKKNLTLLTVLLVIAIGWPAPGTAVAQDASQGKKPESGGAQEPADDSAKRAAVMRELRMKLLTSKAEVVGLEGADAKAKVWGVLMEMGLPAGVGTLVSLRDGTSSLYTDTGGGILGGYSAQAEAKAFVVKAEKYLAYMRPTKSFPYPSRGRVKFYLLTPRGVYTAEAPLAQLNRGGGRLFPLFLSGNGVLTRLRLARESQSN